MPEECVRIRKARWGKVQGWDGGNQEARGQRVRTFQITAKAQQG